MNKFNHYMNDRSTRCSAILGMLIIATFSLEGCTLQPAYVSPSIKVPSTWSAQNDSITEPAHTVEDAWWRTLGDDAINILTESTFVDNPTLGQALARIEEAQAILGVNAANKWPTISDSASLTRAQRQNTFPQTSDITMLSTSASAGPSLSWEIDLFGRIRESVQAAQSRLDARTADADTTRLTIAADVANSVLSLRACESSKLVLVDDIVSRERTLALTRLRLETGFAAPVDEARAVSGIANTHTNLATQQEQCTRHVNALVALSGKDARTVRELVGASRFASAAIFMPQAPIAVPELSATLLARHPSVMAADREAAAAWSEIGVARANRLPRLNLAAALTGQWLRAFGSTLDYTTWSIGPSLTGTLFDGGAGAANVNSAEARYHLAVATMQSTLRNTVQEVENALAAQTSAKSRGISTQISVTAARLTLEASQAQWKAGAISLFELEDSRRQYASAQDAEISARRDQAQAWIALVKATGGAITLTLESTTHE